MRTKLRGFGRYGLALSSVALAVAVLELLGAGVTAPIAAEILLLVLIIDGSLFGRGPPIAAPVGRAGWFLALLQHAGWLQRRRSLRLGAAHFFHHPRRGRRRAGGARGASRARGAG